MLTKVRQVSVQFASGQLSTFEVPSTTTVGEFKAMISKAAIMDDLDSESTRGLMYLGKLLDDTATLEACKVADRSCLQEVWRTPESKEAIAKANDDTLAAVKAAADNYGSHAAALQARVKHYAVRPADDPSVRSLPFIAHSFFFRRQAGMPTTLPTASMFRPAMVPLKFRPRPMRPLLESSFSSHYID